MGRTGTPKRETDAKDLWRGNAVVGRKHQQWRDNEVEGTARKKKKKKKRDSAEYTK